MLIPSILGSVNPLKCFFFQKHLHSVFFELFLQEETREMDQFFGEGCLLGDRAPW